MIKLEIVISPFRSPIGVYRFIKKSYIIKYTCLCRYSCMYYNSNASRVHFVFGTFITRSEMILSELQWLDYI